MIRASEAFNTEGSISTVIEGKRNVGWLIIDSKDIFTILDNNSISYLRVKSSKHECYVIFRESHKQDALDLIAIADKYDGYLHFNASDEDTRRIGQLLSYHPDDVEEFINRNKK